MENERLLFPLATLPLELGRQESDTWLPPLLRNYLTWVGFAVPFVVYAINGLHSYFGFFPFIQLNTYVRFLRDLIGLNLRPRFVGFPIRPIGLAPGYNYPIGQIWFSVFIAWLPKAVILK